MNTFNLLIFAEKNYAKRTPKDTDVLAEKKTAQREPSKPRYTCLFSVCVCVCVCARVKGR